MSSIPEVVGDSGILIDPQDVDALSNAITLVTSAPDLRASLAAKALTRSGLFTWQKTVDETVAAYRQVLSNRS